MKKPKKYIIGYYSPYGYEVTLLNNGQIENVLYHAGNHKFDSVQTLPVGHLHSLSLDEIKNYCLQTTKETAKELNVKFSGVELDESLIDEMNNLLNEK